MDHGDHFNFSLFDNIPYRRIKKAVFNLGGMVTKYIRFYSVLPGMDKKEFDMHMDRVRKLARSLNPKQEEKKISWWA